MSEAESRLDALLALRLERIADRCGRPSADCAALRPLLLASDFAFDTLLRQPDLVDQLHAPVSSMPCLSPSEVGVGLRRWRQAASTRLIWRDLQGIDDVEATVAGSTAIADAAVQVALAAAEDEIAQRFGRVRDGGGRARSLIVMGLGKLGGGELNFSSDVDLVYAHAGQGDSDGERCLDAEGWFTRVAQRLGVLLGEITAEGFCHRVDVRLRPYGDSGRLVPSLTGMEAYFQRDGRDWERYAWLKARPVAGDIAGGEALLALLRPFVFRRYLDFTALEGLREMKALITREVERRELADDIKRGPGGIREVEFLVQALQLIRGGREPALRLRGLLPGLAALHAAGLLTTATAARLAEAYRFLRRLENRLQMLRDAQVHAMPADPLDQLRIARGLGFVDATDLQRVLDEHRAVVAEEFAAVLRQEAPRQGGDHWRHYWQGLPEQGNPDLLRAAGFADAETAEAALVQLAGSSLRRGLSDRARERLDTVVPALLEHAAATAQPAVGLQRAVQLLQAIGKRSAYLALLAEQPRALQRLVQIGASSALLADRLVAHPALLDELLDVRAAGGLPIDADIQLVIDQAAAGDDSEAVLLALNEARHSLAFRIGLAWRSGRWDAVAAMRALAVVAEAVVRAVLAVAEREVARTHGRVPGGIAVLGYGSIGAQELGFASDLDLVFVHGSDPHAQSDGPRPLDAARWHLRVVQKVVALLDTPTAAGRLYEVDARLRPDGTKGLLVVSAASFAQYQRERAWTWEHQALVRMRPLAGDATLLSTLDALRSEVLCRPRDADGLARDVAQMRERMRRELDRSDVAYFDLKQGEDGLVDLEFLLQEHILRYAHACEALCGPRDTPGLIDALVQAGYLEAARAQALRSRHAALLTLGLDCTLDGRPRRVPRSRLQG